MVTLEHVNFTTTDARATAAWMCDVFGWKIRWEGDAIYGGHSIHVGDDFSYIALYAPPKAPNPKVDPYTHLNGLNHVAMVVDDLDGTEARVKAAGFATHSHADYEPGRRFYFKDNNGLEFEIVNYD